MDLIISILVLSGINLLCLYGVSGQSCTGKEPIVEPPVLVVKYGSPASATCRVPYPTLHMGWEAPMGATAKENTQQVDWSVNSTDWTLGLGILCFANSDLHGQCATNLPIIIYKIPESVSLFLNHTGPLVEGQQYSLQCEVKSVGPATNLTFIWYRGDTELLTQTYTPAPSLLSPFRYSYYTGIQDTELEQSDFTVDGDWSKDVNVTAHLWITASRVDHSALYSCAVRLQVNTAELIPDTRSDDTLLEVHYKPIVLARSITIVEGRKLELSCWADANPIPTYEWRHNGVVMGNKKNTLTIDSVTAEDKGLYECIVKNSLGEISTEISVEVKGNWTGIIIGVKIIIIVVLIVVIGGVILWKKFKK